MEDKSPPSLVAPSDEFVHVGARAGFARIFERGYVGKDTDKILLHGSGCSIAIQADRLDKGTNGSQYSREADPLTVYASGQS
jgi:hypothetical protein